MWQPFDSILLLSPTGTTVPSCALRYNLEQAQGGINVFPVGDEDQIVATASD